MAHTTSPKSGAGTSNEALAARLRGLRAERKMTQQQMADKLGISIQSVRLRLSGEHTFKLEEVESYCDVFGVTVASLLQLPTAAGQH